MNTEQEDERQAQECDGKWLHEMRDLAVDVWVTGMNVIKVMLSLRKISAYALAHKILILT